jgi:CheY-like chemotaxis protein
LNELNFTSDSVKLLDSFQIPFRILHGNRLIHSNKISAEIADPSLYSIIDKSSAIWDEEIIDYIKISRSSLRVDVKRLNNNEHMMLRINYNGNSCHLIISIPDCRELSFKDCVKYINTVKRIEKIFVVDDDDSITQTYKYILDFLGYETVLFSDPRCAREAMKMADFDLLLSDFNMPEINGFELVKELMEIKPAIPVIICSGLIENYEEMFNSFGTGHHISLMKKPVSIKNMSDTLEVMEFISKICSFCRDSLR